MTRKNQFLILGTLWLWLTQALAAPVIHHQIEARIDPAAGRMEATDRLTLPADQTSWTFLLHEDLSPKVIGGAARLTQIARDQSLMLWRLDLAERAPVTLRYGGTIRHGLEGLREGMGRAREFSRGTIAADGVFLDGQSGWYPTGIGGATDGLLTFEIQVSLPRDWLAVSQGIGPAISAAPEGVRVGWRESQPQNEIYLIAAPFQLYQRSTPIAEAQVYLRTPDPALAERYLAATADYLALYNDLIGPYAYAKFALVENFWETGYGMPSFTLLGPQVIRLPFILHTSYPHEILHNWWGNGVYVDYASGNWSEGLTSYLADHLLRERQGQGEEYRRDTLKAYADYVGQERDFPIREFRGRHDSATQAVGYGKTMMMVHMLRRDLGDATFRAGLRRFYADNRFQAASFADLRRAFESVSGRDLGAFFRHWTERTGAPRLQLTDVQVTEQQQGFLLRGALLQIQGEDPYPLSVPLVIHTAPDDFATVMLPVTERRTPFEVQLPRQPIRLAVDPGFDLFRHLVAGESPATLSALFGAERGLIVLPDAAPAQLAAAYHQLADAWRQGQPGWQVATDAALAQLPTDRPVWLLGWENRFLKGIADATPDVTLDLADRHLELPDGARASADEGLALTLTQRDQAIGWLAAADATAVAALARKVPHYGKYSYLVFAARTSENRLKGQWPIGETALMVRFDGAHTKLSLPPKAPLVAK